LQAPYSPYVAGPSLMPVCYDSYTMPGKETPRQYDMFTGELVDTRTRRQKQLDHEREQPQ
jgi:hypothetical protein